MEPLAICRLVGYRLYRAFAKLVAAHGANADAAASPNAAECAAANFFGDLQPADSLPRASETPPHLQVCAPQLPCIFLISGWQEFLFPSAPSTHSLIAAD